MNPVCNSTSGSKQAAEIAACNAGSVCTVVFVEVQAIHWCNHEASTGVPLAVIPTKVAQPSLVLVVQTSHKATSPALYLQANRLPKKP